MSARDSLAGMRRPTDEELSAVRRDPGFLATYDSAVTASNRVLRPRLDRAEKAQEKEEERHAAALRKIEAARQAAHEAAREAALRIERRAYEVALVRIMRANDRKAGK